MWGSAPVTGWSTPADTTGPSEKTISPDGQSAGGFDFQSSHGQKNPASTRTPSVVVSLPKSSVASTVEWLISPNVSGTSNEAKRFVPAFNSSRHDCGR